ncbi:UPF0481 protein [Camellia lanceoleosa]|uniref:UPF0481 protein n=1 Tax=Camellia lanceoleosa TaxID=1840588 RepID=A0ACC0FGN4_9ERIC|nr:UPF0481 protein [Camellia lanceoleosa]
MVPSKSSCVYYWKGVENSNFMSGTSIYRVPKWLYNLNKKAYTPRLVSIKPFHYKDQHLKTPMADIKMNYVNSFLARMSNIGVAEAINETQIMEETKEESLLTDARKCYAEEVDDELDDEMLVIDRCFILELLYKFQEKGLHQQLISGSPLTFYPIQHDLLHIENQLPFYVLDKLFLLTKKLMPTSSFSSSSSSSTPPPDSLIECVCSYFSTITDLGPTIDRSSNNNNKSGPKRSCWKGVTKSVIMKVEKDYCHILHILVDDFHSFTDGNKKNPVRESLHIQPYVKTHHFKIPTLTIDDSTELFFGNFFAFKQCCPGFKRRFTSYAYLMDKLISTVKDVELLEKAEVISDYLGSHEEAIYLFNKLCKNVDASPCHFNDAYGQATGYTKRCFPKAIAYLRREYFATPWTTIAFVVAFIGFGITVTKFIRSFLL